MLLIAVFIISCVVLTGCGDKKENPPETNDAQQSTTVTEAVEPTELGEVNPNAILDTDGYYS